jgi:biopolymer transport protein ExbB
MVDFMEPAQTLGFTSFITHTDAIGKGILTILLVMSIATWYLIITKALTVWTERKRSAGFLDTFWNEPSTTALESQLEERHPDEPFAHLAWHAVGARRKGNDEFLTRAMRRVIDEDTARLEAGLTVLASVGSTAPFVGLFGTVWGIYHALTAIGIAGQASIDKVAGPVGEALIMTAFGLAVAVPAVLGYNWLIRRNKAAMERVRSFGADLHAVLLSTPKTPSPVRG